MKKALNTAIGIIISIVVIVAVGVAIEEIDIFKWNPNDYCRITDVEYKAVVVDEPGSRGKVVITERLTFDIHAASKDNLFWELWRDLPEGYIGDAKVDYKVNSVKQVFSDGRAPVEYGKSSKLYWYDSDFTDTAAGYGPG